MVDSPWSTGNYFCLGLVIFTIACSSMIGRWLFLRLVILSLLNDRMGILFTAGIPFALDVFFNDRLLILLIYGWCFLSYDSSICSWNIEPSLTLLHDPRGGSTPWATSYTTHMYGALFNNVYFPPSPTNNLCLIYNICLAVSLFYLRAV